MTERSIIEIQDRGDAAINFIHNLTHNSMYSVRYTFPDQYSPRSLGADDPKARQGHYFTDCSSRDAIARELTQTDLTGHRIDLEYNNKIYRIRL